MARRSNSCAGGVSFVWGRSSRKVRGAAMLVDRFGRRRCEWVARPGCSVVRCVQFGGGGCRGCSRRARGVTWRVRCPRFERISRVGLSLVALRGGVVSRFAWIVAPECGWCALLWRFRERGWSVSVGGGWCSVVRSTPGERACQPGAGGSLPRVDVSLKAGAVDWCAGAHSFMAAGRMWSPCERRCSVAWPVP
mgnify:FL=1